MADALCTYYVQNSRYPTLWNIPVGPVSKDRLFCMSLAAATNDLRVSEALCIPATLYEI